MSKTLKNIFLPLVLIAGLTADNVPQKIDVDLSEIFSSRSHTFSFQIPEGEHFEAVMRRMKYNDFTKNYTGGTSFRHPRILPSTNILSDWEEEEMTIGDYIKSRKNEYKEALQNYNSINRQLESSTSPRMEAIYAFEGIVALGALHRPELMATIMNEILDDMVKSKNVPKDEVLARTGDELDAFIAEVLKAFDARWSVKQQYEEYLMQALISPGIDIAFVGAAQAFGFERGKVYMARAAAIDTLIEEEKIKPKDNFYKRQDGIFELADLLIEEQNTASGNAPPLDTPPAPQNPGQCKIPPVPFIFPEELRDQPTIL